MAIGTTTTTLVRRSENHVTQTITKLKTTIKSTVRAAFTPRLAPARRNVSTRQRPAAPSSLSPLERMLHKASKTTAAACRALTTALHVPDAIAKPLAKFTSLAHKYVFSKLPTVKVLDKLKQFAKFFLSHGIASTALQSEHANRLVERFVRGWVGRVKGRIALRHYKAAVHSAVTTNVMHLLDATTAHVASQLHQAWYLKQTNAANRIQHAWRHASSRWALEAHDTHAAIQYLRETGSV
ncbi:hypothetical protein DYB37_008835 [Aphanomyces astaci]|uniref:Uncharacterized protein n=2 Tax=Aphanomyces astaci TaxID=112090 RepID=A0A3R6X245_APHAT|nr:hypothetical protein DYB37_008835 [Aphanomyces astaci]